ncbi:MAG TPA: DUF6334 family protein [Jatrophihabitans sp.]|jgi:hypothetical protein
MTSLARVAEDFGLLTGIWLDEFETDWIHSIQFEFERGLLTVGIDIDTDTIQTEVGETRSEKPSGRKLADPWQALISSSVRWIWVLTNHRGFRDGLQIEFSKDEQDTDLQIMAEASRLWTYRLVPL